MTIKELIVNLHVKNISGDVNQEVSSVHFDSRRVEEGAVFVAVKGKTYDGHEFIDKAVDRGAVCVIIDQDVMVRESVCVVQVSNSARALGIVASTFYGDPSTQLTMVGVTGTNGKTTIATLLYKLFTALGYTCGLLSTVQNQVGNEVLPATHTTPDQISINALLKQMVDAGCTHVFMECSSHAMHQHRIDGLYYSGALFSNITH